MWLGSWRGSLLTRYGAYTRLVGVVIVLLGALLGPLLAQPAIAPTEFNPIVAENRLPGSDHWRLGRPGFAIADDVNGQIKGYGSQTSVNRGGNLVLHVSVSPPQSYTIDVFRIGWYAGHGGRLIQHIGPLPGTKQASCPREGATGLIACNWTPSITLQVPRFWATGIYMALLTNSQNFQSYVPFVVRDDQASADLLYKQPVNTYQAYNNYPDDRQVGKSLYEHNSYGAITLAGTARAVKVSFDRPYAGNGAGQFFEWEYFLVRWLERNGYDVAYTTDVDFHTDPNSLKRFKGVVFAGHDEYWSKQMFDAAASARDAGVNLAFFGADAGDWQARYEASSSGASNRVLVCYRDAALDPEPDAALKTVWWRNPPLNRPPQALVGVQLRYVLSTNAPLIVTHTDSWAYTNTGFRDGDAVPGIVGYEVDSSMPDFLLPESLDNSYTLLSASPVTDQFGLSGVSNSSLYRAHGGGWVFATGTMSWSWALDPERNYDPRLAQLGANILDRFVTGEPPTGATQPSPTPYLQSVLADRPLGYWPLDDRRQPLARDLSANHRTGIVLGGIGPAAVGSHSDGSGGVALPSLPPVGDFTIDGWTRLEDPNWNSDVSYDNTLYGASEHVRLLVRPGAPTNINTSGYFGVWLDKTEYALQPLHDGVDDTGQWVYWAMVRRGGTLTVYRNGGQVAQRTDLPAGALANISGSIFAQGDTLRFRGMLSDVAVYGSALSVDDIRQRSIIGRPLHPAISAGASSGDHRPGGAQQDQQVVGE